MSAEDYATLLLYPVSGCLAAALGARAAVRAIAMGGSGFGHPWTAAGILGAIAAEVPRSLWPWVALAAAIAAPLPLRGLAQGSLPLAELVWMTAAAMSAVVAGVLWGYVGTVAVEGRPEGAVAACAGILVLNAMAAAAGLAWPFCLGPWPYPVPGAVIAANLLGGAVLVRWQAKRRLGAVVLGVVGVLAALWVATASAQAPDRQDCDEVLAAAFVHEAANAARCRVEALVLAVGPIRDEGDPDPVVVDRVRALSVLPVSTRSQADVKAVNGCWGVTDRAHPGKYAFVLSLESIRWLSRTRARVRGAYGGGPTVDCLVEKRGGRWVVTKDWGGGYFIGCTGNSDDPVVEHLSPGRGVLQVTPR